MSRLPRRCPYFLESQFALSLPSAIRKNSMRTTSLMLPLQAGSPLLSWPPVCFISCDLLQSACQLLFMSQTWEGLQEMKNRQHKHKAGLQALLRASPHTLAGCQGGCKAHQEQVPSCSPALSTTCRMQGVCMEPLDTATACCLWQGHNAVHGSGLLFLPRTTARSGNIPQHLLHPAGLSTQGPKAHLFQWADGSR